MKEAQASISPIEQPSGITAPARKTASQAFNPVVHGMRGMAAFLVFIAHILGGVGENIYSDRPAYLALVEGPWNFGRWGVWLFFVISGFVILPSAMRYSPKEFALRRFLRLYPLFFAFSVAFIMLNLATNAFPELNSVGTIIAALLMVNLFTHTEQLTPNAWSLSYEVVFYTVTCLTVYWSLKRRNQAVTVLLALVSALLISRFPAMAFFVVGVVVRLLYDRGIRPAAGVCRAFEAAALIGCVYFASVRHYTFGLKDLADPLTYGVFISTAAYFYFAIVPNSLTAFLLDRRPVFYLGTVSYSLYLSHPYTYFGMRQVFERLGLFGEAWLPSIVVFLLTVVPVGLLLNHVVYLALERYPYRAYFSQRIYRG